MTQPPPLDAAVHSLSTGAWCVIPGFLPQPTCASLVQEIEAKRGQGRFRSASIGRGDEQKIRLDIRADLIHWLGDEPPSQATQTALDRLEELRLTLNRSLYLGLKTLQCHLTVYPAGAHYQRHVDNFRGTSASGRLLSVLIYLNPAWQPEDGGELVLYPADQDVPDTNRQRQSHTPLTKVLPQEGTLACFLSKDIPHEVLPPTRTRYSLTGWFLRD